MSNPHVPGAPRRSIAVAWIALRVAVVLLCVGYLVGVAATGNRGPLWLRVLICLFVGAFLLWRLACRVWPEVDRWDDDLLTVALGGETQAQRVWAEWAAFERGDGPMPSSRRPEALPLPAPKLELDDGSRALGWRDAPPAPHEITPGEEWEFVELDPDKRKKPPGRTRLGLAGGSVVTAGGWFLDGPTPSGTVYIWRRVTPETLALDIVASAGRCPDCRQGELVESPTAVLGHYDAACPACGAHFGLLRPGAGMLLQAHRLRRGTYPTPRDRSGEVLP